MFNNAYTSLLNWYTLFIYLEFTFVLFVLLQLVYIYIIKSSSTINFFFNILFYIVLLTILIFIFNAGAYAGFLFLCEIISIFTLFVLLNKLNSDQVVLNKTVLPTHVIYLFIWSITSFFLFKKIIISQTTAVYFKFFNYEFLNNNDFWCVAELFYTNTYNIFLFICVFLLVITLFIITVVYYTTKYSNFGCVLIKQVNITTIISKLFTENNIVQIKKKINIFFFKK